MRILFLTPWYPDEHNPHYGVFIRDQAEALAKNHEVTLVASIVDYRSFGILSFHARESSFHGVKEHRLVVKRSIPLYNQINYLAITVLYTLKVARRFRPDIIHGNIGFPGAFWSWAIGKLVNVQFVITEHVTWFAGNLRTFFHRRMTLPFMRRAAAILSVSKASAADIASFVKKEPVIIPNIIAVDAFQSVVTVPAGPTSQIGFLGGLDGNRKGLDILLQAAANVKNDFLLHIGGAGKMLDTYRTMARELGVEGKCVFYGLIPDQRVPEFMSRLHFFVSSSRAEGFGMVIAEAMACGLPVIVTRSGGPEDFVNNENGILIPKEDVDQLRNALEWMIENSNSFDKMEIRAGVVKHYSPEVISSMISQIYSRVIAGQSIR